MTIKAILFDFGGTLDSNGADWFTRIHRNIEKQIGPVDWDLFDRCAHEAADDICHLDDTPTLNLDDTARRLCQHTHMKFPGHLRAWTPNEVAREFIEGCHAQVRRNLPTIQKLAQTYRLGCISNNWGNAAGWCRQFGLHEYFETIIDSTVVGAAKPDPAIFRAALDEMNLTAQQCAYVGDKYTADIIGAHRSGLTPVWITNGSAPADTESINPKRISAIDDLLTITW